MYHGNSYCKIVSKNYNGQCMTNLFKNKDDDDSIHDSVSHSNNFIREEIFHEL